MARSKKYTCTECKTVYPSSYDMSYEEGICMGCNSLRWEKSGSRMNGPVTIEGDGYSGWNEGLGAYIRSKSHYNEEVKKRGVQEAG